MLPSFNPMPAIGPSAYTIAGFRGVSVPAGGSVGPVGSDASVITPQTEFQFPRDLFVTGLLFFPRTGDLADLASLTFRLQDESSDDFIGTGITLDHTVDGLSLFGRRGAIGTTAGVIPYMRPFALQRPVKCGDRWLITIGNVSGLPIVLAGVFLYFSEPRPARHARGVNA